MLAAFWKHESGQSYFISSGNAWTSFNLFSAFDLSEPIRDEALSELMNISNFYCALIIDQSRR